MAEQPETFKMRLDPMSAYQLDALEAKLGIPRTAIMKLALRRLSDAEGVPEQPGARATKKVAA